MHDVDKINGTMTISTINRKSNKNQFLNHKINFLLLNLISNIPKHPKITLKIPQKYNKNILNTPTTHQRHTNVHQK